MQFRIVEGKHRGTIQLIRSAYDKAQKPEPRKIKTLDGQEVMVPGVRRSTQTVVGTMGRHDKKPTAELVNRLTDSERTELSKFLSDLHDKDLSAYQAELITSAPANLKELTDAIGTAKTVSNEQAAKIWEGIGEIQKALKKAGHPKPAKPPKEQTWNKDDAQMESAPSSFSLTISPSPLDPTAPAL